MKNAERLAKIEKQSQKEPKPNPTTFYLKSSMRLGNIFKKGEVAGHGSQDYH
jgi:hypothetical protein